MRTIKFRAWDEKEKRMISPETDLRKFYQEFGNPYVDVLVELDGSAQIVKHYPYESPSYLNNELVLLQFTGQRDKNGTEIFEGDVLKFELAGGDVLIGSVDFEEYDSSFVFAYGKQLFGFDEEYGMEVVGNIYENPELLEASE